LSVQCLSVLSVQCLSVLSVQCLSVLSVQCLSVLSIQCLSVLSNIVVIEHNVVDIDLYSGSDARAILLWTFLS
jgi:hypothetical protein